MTSLIQSVWRKRIHLSMMFSWNLFNEVVSLNIISFLDSSKSSISYDEYDMIMWFLLRIGQDGHMLEAN